MKTDPTASIAGTAGTPLSHQAIESGNRMASHPNLKTNRSDAISDTVETSDREADGRLEQPAQKKASSGTEPSDPTQPENGERLDLEA